MSVEFTGRNVQVTPTLKELAEERALRLERHLGGPASVRVVVSHEKHRFGVEVIATHRRRLWKAQGETADPRAALTLAFEKVDAQAKKDSERRRDRKHRGATASASLKQRDGQAAESGRPSASKPIPPMTQRIVRNSQRFPVKPMSAEEAALRIDGSKLDFLVFRDSGTLKISVLYRRRDGDFGLIVPEC